MLNQLKLSTIYAAISFFFFTLHFPLYASDLAKEQRMREQVVDYVMDGEVVFLKDGTHDFLSIYMLADAQPAKGTVIILHGRGFHPNWPKLVYPLRSGLPEHGWNTLSIQLPVLNNQASFYDYLKILPESHPRIEAAIHYLKQKKITNIIMLAHSCGVYMGFDWLHKNPQGGISAFIGVSMGPTDTGQPMLEPFALEDIKIPVLDIRGENDYPAVQINAPRRWARIQQAGNPKSQQRIVKNSGHYYTETSDQLLEEIVEWLNTLN
jgi:uncharacterized protein DUF3530